MRTHNTLAAGFLMGAAASACGGAKPAEAPPAPAPIQALAPETPTQGATRGAVRISTDILKACGLPDADSYFSFDSTQLEKRDISPLNAITTCFTTGALKGRSMKLVGRADPRGASDYNMTLGQSRADAVEKYLGNKGLQKGKVESTSRGAMDATGTDEFWLESRPSGRHPARRLTSGSWSGWQTGRGRRARAAYVVVDNLAYVVVLGNDRDLDAAVLLVGALRRRGVDRAEFRVRAGGEVVAVRGRKRFVGFEEVVQHGRRAFRG